MRVHVFYTPSYSCMFMYASFAPYPSPLHSFYTLLAASFYKFQRPARNPRILFAVNPSPGRVIVKYARCGRALRRADIEEIIEDAIATIRNPEVRGIVKGRGDVARELSRFFAGRRIKPGMVEAILREFGDMVVYYAPVTVTPRGVCVRGRCSTFTPGPVSETGFASLLVPALGGWWLQLGADMGLLLWEREGSLVYRVVHGYLGYPEAPGLLEELSSLSVEWRYQKPPSMWNAASSSSMPAASAARLRSGES